MLECGLVITPTTSHQDTASIILLIQTLLQPLSQLIALFLELLYLLHLRVVPSRVRSLLLLVWMITKVLDDAEEYRGLIEHIVSVLVGGDPTDVFCNLDPL